VAASRRKLIVVRELRVEYWCGSCGDRVELCPGCFRNNSYCTTCSPVVAANCTVARKKRYEATPNAKRKGAARSQGNRDRRKAERLQIVTDGTLVAAIAGCQPQPTPDMVMGAKVPSAAAIPATSTATVGRLAQAWTRLVDAVPRRQESPVSQGPRPEQPSNPTGKDTMSGGGHCRTARPARHHSALQRPPPGYCGRCGRALGSFVQTGTPATSNVSANPPNLHHIIRQFDSIRDSI
jgi:hypothetical protein